MLRKTTLLAGLAVGSAIDNGKGITPVRRDPPEYAVDLSSTDCSIDSLWAGEVGICLDQM